MVIKTNFGLSIGKIVTNIFGQFQSKNATVFHTGERARMHAIQVMTQ